MRTLFFAAAALTLTACAAPGGGPVSTAALVAADAATSLAVGERISEEMATQGPSVEGADPVISLTLRHGDGRRLAFQQANHTNNDLLAQAPGGPLAQIMGLPGEASPVLYHSTSGEGAEGAFFCGPQGPASLGVFEAPDGNLLIIGLRQAIQFETRPDGQVEALPYSPDQVCARLRFRRG